MTSGETATFSVTGVSGSFWCARIFWRSFQNGMSRIFASSCTSVSRPEPVGRLAGQTTTAVDEDVPDDHAAVAVDDRPPGRLDGVAPQLVLHRRRSVLVRREDLERPQPEEEGAEGDEREAAEDGDAHRHPGSKEIRLLDLRVGREEARERLAGR